MPMYLAMICPFCENPLEWQSHHSGAEMFDLYVCRECQKPDHQTLYRRLYERNKFDQILADNLKMDEYFIVRYFQPTSKGSKYNYTVIYKEVLGVLDNCSDMEPITLNKPVCEIDFIINLPWRNIELAKRKLSTWAVFS